MDETCSFRFHSWWCVLLDLRAARGVGVGRVLLLGHVSCCRCWKSGIARLVIAVVCGVGLRDTPARYDLLYVHLGALRDWADWVYCVMLQSGSGCGSLCAVRRKFRTCFIFIFNTTLCLRRCNNLKDGLCLVR